MVWSTNLPKINSTSFIRRQFCKNTCIDTHTVHFTSIVLLWRENIYLGRLGANLINDFGKFDWLINSEHKANTETKTAPKVQHLFFKAPPNTDVTQATRQLSIIICNSPCLLGGISGIIG